MLDPLHSSDSDTSEAPVTTQVCDLCPPVDGASPGAACKQKGRPPRQLVHGQMQPRWLRFGPQTPEAGQIEGEV